MTRSRTVECRGPIELQVVHEGKSSASILRAAKLRPQAVRSRGWVGEPLGVQIRVRCVGLGPEDVDRCLLRTSPSSNWQFPAVEFTGTVTAIGASVTKVRVGDDVMGLAPGGCFKTFTTTSEGLVCRMPQSMSFEEGCALPVVASTVELALGEVGKVKRGERVLVHATSGGVGIIAVRYCVAVGAKVTVTVTSSDLKDYVESIGAELGVVIPVRRGDTGSPLLDNIEDEDDENEEEWIFSFYSGLKGKPPGTHVEAKDVNKFDLVFCTAGTCDQLAIASVPLLLDNGRFVDIDRKRQFTHPSVNSFVASASPKSAGQRLSLTMIGQAVTPVAGALKDVRPRGTYHGLSLDGRVDTEGNLFNLEAIVLRCLKILNQQTSEVGGGACGTCPKSSLSFGQTDGKSSFVDALLFGMPVRCFDVVSAVTPTPSGVFTGGRGGGGGGIPQSSQGTGILRTKPVGAVLEMMLADCGTFLGRTVISFPSSLPYRAVSGEWSGADSEAAIVQREVRLSASQSVSMGFETVEVTEDGPQQAPISSVLCYRYNASALLPLSDLNERSYVVTGGLGSLAGVVCQWLIEEGGKTILLLSRRDVAISDGDGSGGYPPPSSAATNIHPRISMMANSQEGWAWIASNKNGLSVNLLPVRCDVSQEQDVRSLLDSVESKLNLPVVKGIFHAAGVLADASLNDQSEDKVSKVYRPKVNGAWNLHKALEERGLNRSLDIFLVFSSVSALLGNYGQTNYAAANSALDAFVEYRRRLGYAGQSIQWGPWTEQGMAADPMVKSNMEKAGMTGISNELGLRVLSDIVRRTTQPSDIPSVIGCQHINWAKFIQRFDAIPKFLSETSAFSSEVIDDDNPAARLSSYSSMSAQELRAFVQKVVVDTALSVMSGSGGIYEAQGGGGEQDESGEKTSGGTTVEGGEAGLRLNLPLTDSGLDSLGAVEFSNQLSQKLNVKMSPTTLFDYPTLNAIIDYVSDQLTAVQGSRAAEGGTGVELSLGRGLNAAWKADGDGVYLAVVGAACRLPGSSNNISKFWNMMDSKIDCMSEILLSRFNIDACFDLDAEKKGRSYVREASFVEDVEMFDATFFSVSVAEVLCMDPQQRMLLEVSFEAIRASGWRNVDSLTNSDIGVWIGCCNFDWHYMAANNDPNTGSPFSCTGGSMSLVSNRISYAFGLRGPSMTVDTACSSSLVAMDAAFEKVRGGVCEGAIVGGVNLILSPQLFIGFCKTRMLSPDCRCKTFDAAANGYARGEGCGAVMLLPLASAEAAGKNILAVVRGTGVNHVGRGATLTAPNGPAQQAVIMRALKKANLSPEEVSFVESHGTGTALGDPIEVGAIKATYGRGRTVDSEIPPLVLGALKTNIGHLEGGAGIAGFLKLILCLHNQSVPANLHFKSLNPHIDLEGVNHVFPTDTVTLLSPDQCVGLGLGSRSNVAGAVSSFGFGGANGHIVVEQYTGSQVKRVNAVMDVSEVDSSKKETLQGKVTFLFTGQGSQYVNMGKDLMESESEFKTSMEFCDQFLRPYMDMPLLKLIYPDERDVDEMKKLINETKYSQLAIFSIEYALCKVLASKGVKPDIVMGHSLGEYVAATVAGVMSIEDGLRLVAERGKIMSNTPSQDGVMAATRSSESEVLAAVKALSDKGTNVSTVSVAAVNGPKSVVVAGQRNQVDAVLTRMNMAGRVKYLDVSHAFHSPLMESTVKQMSEVANTIRFTPPHADRIFVSTNSGKAESNLITTSDYWAQHITQCVRFQDALVSVALAAGDGSLMVEIGPRPTLVTMGRSVTASSHSVKAMGVVKFIYLMDSAPSFIGSAKAIAELSTLCTRRPIKDVEGDVTHRGDVKHADQGDDSKSLSLQSEGDDSVAVYCASLPKWNHSQPHPWTTINHPFVGHLSSPVSEPHTQLMETRVRKDVIEWVGDHVVNRMVLMPGAGFVEMVNAATRRVFAVPDESSGRGQWPETMMNPILGQKGEAVMFPGSNVVVSMERVDMTRPLIVSSNVNQPVPGGGSTHRNLTETSTPTATPEITLKISVNTQTNQFSISSQRVPVITNPGGGDGDEGEELEHAAGKLNAMCNLSSMKQLEREPLAELKKRLVKTSSPDNNESDDVGVEKKDVSEKGGGQGDVKEGLNKAQFYDLLKRAGLHYGPRFQTVEEIHFENQLLDQQDDVDTPKSKSVVDGLNDDPTTANTPNELLCKLRVQDADPSTMRPGRWTDFQFETGFGVHPSLLDGAFQSAAVLIGGKKGAKSSSASGVYVPIRCDKVLIRPPTSVHKPPMGTSSPRPQSTSSGAIWGHIVLLPSGPGNTQSSEMSVTLYEEGEGQEVSVTTDPGGASEVTPTVLLPLIHIEKLTVKQVDMSLPVYIPKDLLWEVEWIPAELTPHQSGDPSASADSPVEDVTAQSEETREQGGEAKTETAHNEASETQNFLVVTTDANLTQLSTSQHPNTSLTFQSIDELECKFEAFKLEIEKLAEEKSSRPHSPSETSVGEPGVGPLTDEYVFTPFNVSQTDGIIFFSFDDQFSGKGPIGCVAHLTRLCRLMSQAAGHQQHGGKVSKVPCLYVLSKGNAVVPVGEQQKLENENSFHVPVPQPQLSQDVSIQCGAMVGLTRSARLEIEASVGKRVSIKLVDLDMTANVTTGIQLDEIVGLVKRVAEQEHEIAIRDDQVHVSRMTRSRIDCRGPVELHMSERGALSNLTLRPLSQATRVTPVGNQVEIRVRAVGLNFRDVLNVMGLYPGDPGPPGADCAGTVVAVGDKVTSLKVGDNVFGVAPGCLRSYCITEQNVLCKMPMSLSFDEASALPVVASTVELALGDLGKVKKGERVLVHAASGGVGIMAIQHCRRVGASVVGTVGNDRKKEFILSIGVDQVSNSRDSSVFRREMSEMLGPDGRVDVVLNCLIDDFIPASLDFLAHGGRFIELGKRGTWPKEKMREKRPDVQYEIIAVDQMTEEDPDWFGGMLKRVKVLVEEEMLVSLPLHVFDATETSDSGVAAFRFLQRAHHIGKVVCQFPSALSPLAVQERSAAAPISPTETQQGKAPTDSTPTISSPSSQGRVSPFSKVRSGGLKEKKPKMKDREGDRLVNKIVRESFSEQIEKSFVITGGWVTLDSSWRGG
eukprot:GHVN01079079.1.p1 GENE.GHVN01079079.1~~GHVN01079079.1.p1  ORF type:complete len:3270 (-),score=711.43 GHVN01079079.1:66-9350(-)